MSGKITDYEKSEIESVYAGYKAAYGFPQGYCGQIAEKIQSKIGGEIVAGTLNFSGSARQHWWVEKNGVIIDPMSDELMKTDPPLSRRNPQKFK